MALGSSTQATDRELTQCLSGVSPAGNPKGGNRPGMRRGTETQSVAKKLSDDDADVDDADDADDDGGGGGDDEDQDEVVTQRRTPENNKQPRLLNAGGGGVPSISAQRPNTPSSRSHNPRHQQNPTVRPPREAPSMNTWPRWPPQFRQRISRPPADQST